MKWVGCGECDLSFPCHEGKQRCIRLPVQDIIHICSCKRAYKVVDAAFLPQGTMHNPVAAFERNRQEPEIGDQMRVEMKAKKGEDLRRGCSQLTLKADGEKERQLLARLGERLHSEGFFDRLSEFIEGDRRER